MTVLMEAGQRKLTLRGFESQRNTTQWAPATYMLTSHSPYRQAGLLPLKQMHPRPTTVLHINRGTSLKHCRMETTLFSFNKPSRYFKLSNGPEKETR